MVSITLPVSESDVKQMEAAGLLADLPHRATPAAGGQVSLEFSGGDLDLYRFSQRYVRKIQQGFWYDPDRTPGNGDDFYILGRQLEECTVETRGPQPDLDTELAFLQEGKRGPLTAYSDNQVSSLKGLGIFQNLKGVARGDLCRVLNSRIASHPSAQAGFVWDNDGDPNSGDHFFVSTMQHEALLPVLGAVKPPAQAVMETPYGKMRTVEGDRETGDLYEYRLLLTNKGNGKTDLIPTALTREQATFDQPDLPAGFDAPTPGEFKQFAEIHPEYFEQGRPSPTALVESSFRISIASNGKPVPIVAKSSISGCPSGMMKIQGLHVMPVALSDEEAVELASLTRPGSSSTGIICVSENPVEDSNVRALGKRIYEIRLDGRKLAIAIETLKGKIDSHADPIELLPGYFVSNAEAKAHLRALEEIRDGTFDFNVWAQRHPGTVYAVDKVFSLLLIAGLVAGGYVLISTDWVSGRIATGNLKRAKFEREIAATMPRDWFKELGAEDMTEAAREGKYKYVVANPDVLPEMIATFSRKERNNYFSVRPTGSGKTSDYEALANTIAEGKAENLNGRKLVSVKLSSLVAFSGGVQGSFEAAVLGVLEQARRENAILFWDEAALIKYIGTHSGRSRGMDMELLQALNRGLAPSGFATTDVEFEKDFPLGEADPLVGRCVLDRKPPPSGKHLAAVLAMQIRRHQEQNGVEIEKGVLATAEKRAIEIFPGMAQPRRTVALLDAAVDFVLSQRRRQKAGQLISGEKVYARVTEELVGRIIEKKKGERRDQRFAVVRDGIEAELNKALEKDFDLAPERELLERGAREGEAPHEYAYRMSHLLRRLQDFNALLREAELDPLKIAEVFIDMRKFVAAGGFVADLDRDEGESTGARRDRPEPPKGPPPPARKAEVVTTGWEGVEDYRIEDAKLAVALTQHDPAMGKWYREEFPAADPPRTLGELVYRLIDTGHEETLAETLEILTREGRLLSDHAPGDLVLQVLARTMRVPDGVLNETDYRVGLFRKLQEFREKTAREGAVARVTRAESEERDSRLEEFRRKILHRK